MAPLKAFVAATAATAVAAFQPARVGPSQLSVQLQPRRSFALAAVQPSRRARLLNKVTFGLLGEEKVEERPVFFQDRPAAAQAPRSNNYSDDLEAFMDTPAPAAKRKVLKAPTKIVDGDDDADEDSDDAAPALREAQEVMASDESVAKLQAMFGMATAVGSGAQGGQAAGPDGEVNLEEVDPNAPAAFLGE